jgi:hypothetical protein
LGLVFLSLGFEEVATGMILAGLTGTALLLAALVIVVL